MKQKVPIHKRKKETKKIMDVQTYKVDHKADIHWSKRVKRNLFVMNIYVFFCRLTAILKDQVSVTLFAYL